VSTEGFANGYSRDNEAQVKQLLSWGDDLSWLCFEWPRKLRQSGGDLRGFSFCAKPNGWLLTVRVTRNDTPEVVFINRMTPTDCVSVLRRKEREGTLTFFVDHYA
jgi:hypothetical protein